MWQLLSKIIEECTGMTGDQVADKVRIERGADWIRLFKKEHPIAALFLDRFINGSPDEALTALKALDKNIAALPFARVYIEGLQQALRSKKK